MHDLGAGQTGALTLRAGAHQKHEEGNRKTETGVSLPPQPLAPDSINTTSTPTAGVDGVAGELVDVGVSEARARKLALLPTTTAELVQAAIAALRAKGADVANPGGFVADIIEHPDHLPKPKRPRKPVKVRSPEYAGVREADQERRAAEDLVARAKQVQDRQHIEVIGRLSDEQIAGHVAALIRLEPKDSPRARAWSNVKAHELRNPDRWGNLRELIVARLKK